MGWRDRLGQDPIPHDSEQAERDENEPADRSWMVILAAALALVAVVLIIAVVWLLTLLERIRETT